MAIFFAPDTAGLDAVRSLIDPEVEVVASDAALDAALAHRGDEVLVVFGPDADAQRAFDLASTQRVQRPSLGVILIRRRIDSTMLGRALRSGVREVVRVENTEALLEACHRVQLVASELVSQRRQPEETRQEHAGKVVTVFSAKGGCGKTTIATNLAAAVAGNNGARVCLVDLDLPFGDVAISLQLAAERTLADSIPMAGHIDELGVRSIVATHRSGVDALVAPFAPGEAERITPALISDLLGQLRRMYDVVVVDTPPAFTEQVLAALDATDVFLLVATLDIPAVKNLKLTLEMLQMLGYPSDRQHVVLNRSDSRVALAVADVERALHRPIAVEIPSSRDVPASINRGVPISLEQPRHPVSNAIRTLVPLVIPVPTAEPVVGKPVRRLTAFRRGSVTA